MNLTKSSCIGHSTFYIATLERFFELKKNYPLKIEPVMF